MSQLPIYGTHQIDQDVKGLLVVKEVDLAFSEDPRLTLKQLEKDTKTDNELSKVIQTLRNGRKLISHYDQMKDRFSVDGDLLLDSRFVIPSSF